MATFPGLVVKKVGMSRMVDVQGNMIAVTLLQVDNQKVTKILTPERDGYHGIQVGYYTKPEFRLSKADVGRLRKVKVEDNFCLFREFRLEQPIEGLEVGHPLTMTGLEKVTAVDVVGITKGRGFQGAIKKHGSKIGRMTHGSMYHRRTGSLGSNTTPARVIKNKKMPGHLGTDQRTVQNLKVVDIDTKNNVIALRGSVPGYSEGYLVIKPSIKAKPVKAD
jgi:large subunit ribosomal protein L3